LLVWLIGNLINRATVLCVIQRREESPQKHFPEAKALDWHVVAIVAGHIIQKPKSLIDLVASDVLLDHVQKHIEVKEVWPAKVAGVIAVKVGKLEMAHFKTP
jgi:elongation factor P--beta-lysine ligase